MDIPLTCDGKHKLWVRNLVFYDMCSGAVTIRDKCPLAVNYFLHRPDSLLGGPGELIVLSKHKAVFLVIITTGREWYTWCK